MSSFIVFEGIDGSGKSTAAQSIADDLVDVYLTREPTGSKVGVLANKVAYEESSPYHELFLYLADRAEHTEHIRKMLEKGKTVICDRYWGSTAAYQAAHGVISMNYLVDIQIPFVLKPDATFLFDLPVSTALERIASSRDDTSKYERTVFLESVKSNYLELACDHDWIVVDACRGPDEIKEIILDTLKDL